VPAKMEVRKDTALCGVLICICMLTRVSAVDSEVAARVGGRVEAGRDADLRAANEIRAEHVAALRGVAVAVAERAHNKQNGEEIT
jgi:hypothetical protein